MKNVGTKPNNKYIIYKNGEKVNRKLYLYVKKVIITKNCKKWKVKSRDVMASWGWMPSAHGKRKLRTTKLVKNFAKACGVHSRVSVLRMDAKCSW